MSQSARRTTPPRPIKAKPRRRGSEKSPLLAWYDEHHRDLPWRNTRDPYAIWLSEIMCQQTQVTTVIPYYERFLSRFPSVHDLAAAPLEEVLRMWSGLGYYARARNMHRAAQQVSENHGGVFPDRAADLEKLSGIGRYTAAAIASIVHDEPVAVLDGNVARVVARLHAVDAPIDAADKRETLWQHAQSLMPAKRCGDHNQAMMELGATLCTPRAPSCILCPLSDRCAARAQGLTARIPYKSRDVAVSDLAYGAAIVRRGDTILIETRPTTGLWGGLWQVPAEPCEDAASARVAVQKAIRRCTSEKVKLARGSLTTVERRLTHRRVRFTLFEAEVVAGRSRPAKATLPAEAAARWVSVAELSDAPLSTAMRSVLKAAGVTLP